MDAQELERIRQQNSQPRNALPPAFRIVPINRDTNPNYFGPTPVDPTPPPVGY